jgi:hypothetical protein
MMTRAVDRLRSLPPGAREGRAQANAVHQQAKDDRYDAIYGLSDGGRDRAVLGRIGEHLDRTDPYCRGVPEGRPVRQRGRSQ